MRASTCSFRVTATKYSCSTCNVTLSVDEQLVARAREWAAVLGKGGDPEYSIEEFRLQPSDLKAF
jgi:hypothetical protein